MVLWNYQEKVRKHYEVLLENVELRSTKVTLTDNPSQLQSSTKKSVTFSESPVIHYNPSPSSSATSMTNSNS